MKNDEGLYKGYCKLGTSCQSLKDEPPKNLQKNLSIGLNTLVPDFPPLKPTFRFVSRASFADGPASQ